MPAAIAAASLGRIRSPFQRLYHDVGCVDFRREQFGGHVNDDLAGPLPALTGHRGGGTYAKDFLSRRESLCKRDVTAAGNYAAIACEAARLHFHGSSSSIFVLV